MLSLFATIINKLQSLMETEVPHIFEAVFEVTLTMITKNFEVRCCTGKSPSWMFSGLHCLGFDCMDSASCAKRIELRTQLSPPFQSRGQLEAMIT